MVSFSKAGDRASWAKAIGARGAARHPCTSIPGGLTKGITEEQRLEIEQIGRWGIEFAQFSLQLFSDIVLGNKAYVDLILGDIYTHKTYSIGLVDESNHVNFYDGKVSVVAPDGERIGKYAPAEYTDWIAERVEPWTYLKFPYLKKVGWKGFVDGEQSGIYRATPLSRLNAADGMATPLAQEEYERMYATLGGKPAHHTLPTHWARLIEMLYAAERMLELSRDPEITEPNIRTIPTETPIEGVGIAGAERLDHEDVEIGGRVVAEWPAPHKAIAQIQRVCGSERLSGTCFEVQVCVSPLTSRADDLIEDGLPDPSSEVGRARAHRLDLTSSGAQCFHGATAAELPVEPSRPEGDLWSPKSVDGECVHVTGGRVAVHAGEMLGDETLHLRRGEVVGADVDRHGRHLRCLTPQSSLAAKQKLQGYFVDEKVPRTKRISIPLLATEKHIVWVMGMSTDGRFLPGPGTKKVLTVTIRKHPSGDRR